MASEDEVEQLRRMVDVTADDQKWTYEVLASYIDSLSGNLAAAAGAIWREKAASFASLTDVSESGSSRRLSQMHDQALKMASHFDPSDTTDDTRGMSFTTGMERL